MASGFVQNVEIGDEKNQKDYYDKATHYDHVWGQDNIHLGYYPHIASKDLVVLDNVQAADFLTKRMIELGHIDHTSTVLDLGCGKGQAVRVIAEHTGAACTGIDLSTTNIVRANEVAKSLPHLKMQFYEGSFTDIPQAAASQKYSVIFSQVAFCHVHRELPQIFEKAKELLAPGGRMIINDYMGGKKPPTALTRENVHKRLHFEHLHTHQEWRRIAEAAGLVIEAYEDLDKHQAQTYRDMEAKARKLGFKSADGALLADNYAETVRAIEAGETGMNLAVLTLGLPEAPKSLVDASRVYVKKVLGGAGAFARTPIFQGEVVESGVVRRVQEVAMVSGASAFYSVSNDPNCEMRRFPGEERYEIIALRDIAQNEEVTQKMQSKL